MRLKTTAVSLTAALALLASPALAAKPTTTHGKATAPGQLCKSLSHKKTNHGKGKSPFAACVSGAKRAQHEIAALPATVTPSTETETSPGQLCKGMSHKKTHHGKGKSLFAACVSGAAKAQDELND